MASSITPPKVSVCIPCYNHADYLSTTLDSILNQTFQNFEIVLVDDHSLDATYEIACSYRERYPKQVKVFTHPGHINRGISATCNLAIEMSRGEYIAWSGSDDVWYPEKLQYQVVLLERDSNVVLVYGYADIIDSQGRLTGERVGKDITADPTVLLLSGNYIPALSVLHRRSTSDFVGPYDETLLYSDWDMWIRFASHYQFAFIPKPLGKYRVHNHNVFAGKARRIQKQNDLEVLSKIERETVTIGGILKQTFYQSLIKLRLAVILLDLDMFDEASQKVQQAILCDISLLKDISKLCFILDLFNSKLDIYELLLKSIPENYRTERRQLRVNYLRRAAQYHRATNLKEARNLALKACLKDFHQLGNAHLIGILIESFIGNRNLNYLRSFTKM